MPDINDYEVLSSQPNGCICRQFSYSIIIYHDDQSIMFESLRDSKRTHARDVIDQCTHSPVLLKSLTDLNSSPDIIKLSLSEQICSKSLKKRLLETENIDCFFEIQK